jgi:tungstate transport system ATP-binding protein
MVSQDLYAQLHGVVVKRRGKAVLGPLDLDLRGGGFTIVLGPKWRGKDHVAQGLAWG